MGDNTAKATGKPTGRPSAYTSDKAREICQRIALGESLRQITQSPHLPHLSTVQRWLADDRHSDFREQYAQARQDQADYYGDSVLEEADKAIEAASQAEDAKTANAIVQAHRLRIDALK